MRYAKMTKLVDEKVVDTTYGQLDRIHVNQNSTLRRATTPPFAKSTYQQRRRLLQPQPRCGSNEVIKTSAEHSARMVEIPALHHAADEITISNLGHRDAEMPATEANSRRITSLQFQTVLAAQITVGFAVYPLARCGGRRL